MRLGSLFSGALGLDRAVEEFFGTEPAWVCDNDPGATRILAHRAPGVPNLGDITAVDWAAVEPVDVLAAGWPCQPFSHAGKRKGAADERALWPYVREAVRVLRPRHVVLENVGAIVTAGELARAVGDLASLGCVGSFRCLRASDVGAPHRRERVFIWATPADAAHLGHERWSTCSTAAHPDCSRPQRPQPASGRHLPDRRAASHEGIGWGVYGPAIRRWEALTRPAPDPLKGGRLNPEFSEWMLGWPEGWVTDPAIWDGMRSTTARNAQLRAIGNGVVSACALAALQLIDQLEAAA